MPAFEERLLTRLLSLRVNNITAADLRAFVKRLDELGVADHTRIKPGSDTLFGFTTYIYLQIPYVAPELDEEPPF